MKREEAVVGQKEVGGVVGVEAVSKGPESVQWCENALQVKGGKVSPVFTYRSYSNSLSSTSPFTLSLDPVPAPAPPAAPVATVDSHLSSVVLQQEEEIARQGKIITRLHAMCQKQEEGIKAAKAQLRKYRGSALAPAEGPAPISVRSSLSSEGGQEGEGAEELGGTSEFRVNLDLAATVVLLEGQKADQQRMLEELRAELQQKPQQETGLSPTPLSPKAAATASSGMQVEVTALRAQVVQLQGQVVAAGGGAGGSGGALRRDSGVHWANVVNAMRLENEKALKEKEEKIQVLLSAQRVLAESREVKAQQQLKEWREKETEWAAERDRLQEEVGRLRKRMHRLSIESQVRGTQGSRQGSVKLLVPGGGRGGEAMMGVTSPSSGGSSDSEDESDDEESVGQGRFLTQPVMSSTQPLPGAGPPVPNKPSHSLGLVIAARIAAFESKRGEESEAIRERIGMSNRSSRSNTVEALKRKSFKGSGHPVEEEKAAE